VSWCVKVQARGIIGSVQTVIVTVPSSKGPSKEVQTRAFIENTTPGKKGYEPLQVVLASPVSRAWNELQSWKREYETLEELSEIFEVTEAIGPAITKRINDLREDIHPLM